MSNKSLGNGVSRCLNYFFSEFQHNDLPKKIAYSFRVLSVMETLGNKSFCSSKVFTITAVPKIFRGTKVYF